MPDAASLGGALTRRLEDFHFNVKANILPSIAIRFSAGVLLWITAQAGLQATDVTNATFIGGPIFVTAVTAGVALVGFTRRFSRKQVRAYAY
ncbi:hypothetical protein [Curtobacterium sp. MCPF17_018]|uniref:hypothetical protein n=1 Tax=Curtobacterium sp. MCPF17_018 TaxID=2175638 RepID=UPI0011B64145|nr:hypothetical protein [Curtobacterium sp. MCPF17_018]